MESYNNYQDIIDAIKAEYVIVRDLKRVANAKKRELNNAHSFVNRKGNEETTLETRVTNAKQDAYTRAENALTGIQSSINSGYKSALSESIANLANIEAEITKLQTLQTNLPEKWESFSQNEINSINSLKGVLLSAINDTKFIYENDIMESSKFSALTDETKLSIASDDTDIITHYDTVVYGVRQLINSTNDEFKSYITDAADLEEGLTNGKDLLVHLTKELVHLKSELADLLDSNAAQTVIDAKNVAIDAKKSQILEEATEEKEKHYAADVFYTQKHKRFSVYFEIIQSLFEEADEWISQPGIYGLVRQSRANHGLSIQASVRRFVASLLESMRYKMDGELYNEILSTFDTISYAKLQGDHLFAQSYSKMEIIDDIKGRTYNNQKSKFELDPSVSQETWLDTFDYFDQLQVKASGYTYAKRAFSKKSQDFASQYDLFNQQFNLGKDQFSSYLAGAITMVNDKRFELDRFEDGIWTGTPEQEEDYANLLANRRNRIQSYEVNFHTLEYIGKKSGLVRAMFPAFFSSFQPIFDAKVAAIATYNGLAPQLVSLNAAISEAYNLLVTSSEPAEGYVYYEDNYIYVLDNADYATYLAAQAALTAFKNDFANPAYNAKELATVALSEFINNHGPIESFGYGYSAGELHTIIEEEVNLGILVAGYLSDILAYDSDIQTIKSEMVFVPATLEDRIESKGVQSDRYFKEYHNRNFWYQFVSAHKAFIDEISEKVIARFNELSSYQSSEIEALDDLKSFLEGNTAYSTFMNERSYGERLSAQVSDHGEFIKSTIGDIVNISPTQYDQFFSWNSYRGSYFVSDPTFLSEKLRQNASNYRLHANPNFIEEIITFVNTGVSNF